MFTPNRKPRPLGTQVALVVLHSTGGNFRSAVRWLTNRVSRVSAHYVISRSGQVTKLAPLTDVTWHAGRSVWKGRSHGGSINAFSVGVEMAHVDRRQDWPVQQVEAAAKLCAVLLREFSLTTEDIAGHADVCVPTGRKIDPWDFPWRSFLGLVRHYHW